MSFKLSREQLFNSAYYCGAGIDLQPLVRFGDMTTDFIYCSAGISKEELLKGFEESCNLINADLNLENASLKLASVNEFKLSEIEHIEEDRLAGGKPDYFNDNDFENYVSNFKQFYSQRNDYHLEIIFKLKIGEYEKSLRLIHLSGEALATYDYVYRKQGIAAKIFISIQTGLIEIPDRFSNNMFVNSNSKPSIWIRGVWDTNDLNQQKIQTKPDVFNTYGIYNEHIGEFRNWKVPSNNDINSIFDRDKTFRIVMAYGQNTEWIIKSNSQKLSKPGITINKILSVKGEKSLNKSYEISKSDFPLSRLSEITNEATEFINENTTNDQVHVIIRPEGFGFFEQWITHFFDSYIEDERFKLTIDIYFSNKLNFKRMI